MPVLINLKDLYEEEVLLEGSISPGELDVPEDDECIRMKEDVRYSLRVCRQEENVLVRGTIWFALDCECVRCLKWFKLASKLPLEDLFALEGEDSVEVKDECIDLTNRIREDILLAYPQHPLCDERCEGLPQVPSRNSVTKRGTCAESNEDSSAAWGELDKLKLD